MDIPRLQKTLEAAGFTVQWFPTAQAAKEALVARFAGKTIGMGGSVTLRDLGLYEALSQRGTVYWHWQQPGPETLAQAAKAQVYLTSVNALAETGQLVNIDGHRQPNLRRRRRPRDGVLPGGAQQNRPHLPAGPLAGPEHRRPPERPAAAPQDPLRPGGDAAMLRLPQPRAHLQRAVGAVAASGRGGRDPGVPGGGGPGVLIPLVFLRKPSLRGPVRALGGGWFLAFPG